MYSYVFAFYLVRDNMAQMFESNLTFLHAAVEKLGRFLESEVQLLRDRKKCTEMKVVVDFCEKQSNQMVRAVFEGTRDNIWNFRNV